MKKSPDQLRKVIALTAAMATTLGGVATSASARSPKQPTIASVSRQINALGLQPAAKMGASTLVTEKLLQGNQEVAEIAIGATGLLGNKVKPSKVNYIDVAIWPKGGSTNQNNSPLLEYVFNKNKHNKWTVTSEQQDPDHPNVTWHLEEVEEKQATAYDLVNDGTTIEKTNVFGTSSSYIAHLALKRFELEASQVLTAVAHGQAPNIAEITDLTK